MMLPGDWDGVAQERTRSWEAEVDRQHLLRQIPRRRTRWRQWAGGGLVWLGRWLVRWGEQVTEPECNTYQSQVNPL